MSLQFGFVILWQKPFGAKAALKTLVKFTPVVLTLLDQQNHVYGLSGVCLWIAEGKREDRRKERYEIASLKGLGHNFIKSF
jgi:hypothetical protein